MITVKLTAANMGPEVTAEDFDGFAEFVRSKRPDLQVEQFPFSGGQDRHEIGGMFADDAVEDLRADLENLWREWLKAGASRPSQIDNESRAYKAGLADGFEWDLSGYESEEHLRRAATGWDEATINALGVTAFAACCQVEPYADCEVTAEFEAACRDYNAGAHAGAMQRWATTDHCSSLAIRRWANGNALECAWRNRGEELAGWTLANGGRAIETNGDPLFDGDDGFEAVWCDRSLARSE